jgi:folate-binding protein YgfZ
MMAEDITRPYPAVRHAVAWCDRSAEGLVEVSGTDRISWLQGLLSNDVAALKPGEGCYASYLSPQGRMLSDVRVLALDEACWLDLPAVAHERVLTRLGMFVITEDVVLRDLSGDVGRVCLHGPAAANSVGPLLGVRDTGLAGALAALPEWHHLAVESPGGRSLIVANRDLGVPGFDVYGQKETCADFARRAISTGVAEIDPETRTVCRIEAGRPEYGVDMDEETIPLEAGIEGRAISFTKGCYVGQEVIIRVRDRGQGRVARRLMGLRGPASDVPVEIGAGDLLFDGEREVGRLTSAGYSPALGCPVALGYVHRDSAVAGRIVRVGTGARAIEVSVTALPLLEHESPSALESKSR